MNVMHIKKNISLIVAIAIPIVMILFVAASIYVPSLFVKPNFSFIYTIGDSYSYYQPYLVVGGKLAKNNATTSSSLPYEDGGLTTGTPQLYLYDVGQNQSREISFDDAQNFVLDHDAQSPDGFEIVQGGDGGGMFPFFSGSDADYNARYLKGHGFSKKLDIPALESAGTYNYGNNFVFVGWVISQ